jgi:hypothetical protein
MTGASAAEEIAPVSASTQPLRQVTNTAFREGETLSFTVKWGVIKGGNAKLAVGGIEMEQGRPAYHIVSEARSVGIVDAFYKTRDLNETWLDVASLVTLKYEKHIREGRYRVEASVEMDQINHRFKENFERLDKGTTAYVEGNMPPHTMDVLGSLYYVRTLPVEVGNSYVVDVYDGRKIWPLVVHVKKREKIKVPAGKFDTFRLEPVLREPGIFMRKGKKLEVWVTADERRMPVLMRSEVTIGHVSAELTEFHIPPVLAPAPPAPISPEPSQSEK